MDQSLSQELQAYGALPDQIVDLSRDESDVLPYLDLRKGDDGWRVPVAVTRDHTPRVFVFDGLDGVADDVVKRWCRRIILRGDPAWTAVLRPGRLDVLQVEIRDDELFLEFESFEHGTPALVRFIQDVRSGTAELPRRAYLRKLLFESMKAAVDRGVGEDDAVSLVGWGLFWRFLADRGLLAGLQPADIAEGATTWTSCLSTKTRALKTLSWLEEKFNGGLLPFSQPPKTFASEVFSQVLGNIAAGATSTGQLRLPSDWTEIDFGHVPVGLLSEVYEAFAGTLDKAAADARSIHYTPRHIAEFVVAETLDAVEAARPRVLDPAAGAGVFLIAAFRQLVQNEWKRTGKRPARKAIRRILSTQLTAFDIDPRALRLAQLGLYLTALELDPKPTPLDELKFKPLDDVLRLRPEQDGSLAAVSEEFAGKFDAVIGNPPWTAPPKAGAFKKRWVAATGAQVLARLGEERAKAFDLPDANPDLPFLWRAGEWAKPGGQISLVLHARWLFGLSDRSFDARRDIFTAFNVAGVLNGAALRQTQVWPNITAPFCLLFARNEAAPAKGAFHFITPFVESEDAKKQTVLRIDWGDAERVGHEEVRTTPWALKSRFRGDALARRAFAQVLAAGVPLERSLASLRRGLKFRNGYQVGGAAGKQRPAKALHGLPDLKGLKGLVPFALDVSSLPPFRRETLLFPRDRENYAPPLLLISKAIPADPLQPRTTRVEAAVAYHESFHGLSFAGIPDGGEHARYLQVLLQSSLGPFVALMTDGLYGVERETIYLESLNAFPVVPLDRLSTAQRTELRRVSHALENGLDDALFEQLNGFVFDVYGLLDLEHEAIVDTLDTRGPTPASVNCAVTCPTPEERARFLATLSDSLDDVLQASDLHSNIEEVPTHGLPWRVLSISTRSDLAKKKLSIEELLKAADDTGASFVVVPMSKWHAFVGLPDRYRYWTRTQARLLAAELLGGVLGDV